MNLFDAVFFKSSSNDGCKYTIFSYINTFVIRKFC
jgi:hypothetical protein